MVYPDCLSGADVILVGNRYCLLWRRCSSDKRTDPGNVYALQILMVLRNPSSSACSFGNMFIPEILVRVLTRSIVNFLGY